MARLQTANVPESIKVGLRKVYYSSNKDFPREFRQWANVLVGPDPGGEAGRAYLEDLQWGSLGTLAGKPEGDPIQYDIPQEGALVRATPYTFALGFRMTHEAKSDMRYGIAEKQTAELKYSTLHSMEVQAARLLNLAFGTTGGTGLTAAGFDTLALISTAHTLLGGGTYANRATTDADLSVTALELAIDTFEGTVNEQNMAQPRRASKLCIPYQLKWIAKELIESELKPWTANNEVNPIKGELQYMISHYLTDADSWYLLGDKDSEMGHDLNVWIREEPAYEIGDDFDTGDSKAKAAYRIATWHGDWRSTYASAGA